MNNRKSFIVGIKSTTLNNAEKNFIKRHKPWGVILFTRNIKNIIQTKKLTTSIRNIFNDKKYPILIDQEGGRVNRLKNLISFDTLTSEYFGKLFLSDKRKFHITYKLYIDKTSYLLNLLGININTAPVLDLQFKGASNIIGDRSFSNNPYIVSKLGDYCIKLFKQNSIGTVIKHIPGHGLAKVDSHHFTPVINKSLKFLKKNDFLAFQSKKSLFAMTAHIIFKSIDRHNTVTHSNIMIELIRNQIKFRNVLISDDLSMKSLKKTLVENTINTFKSGCNLALHCNGNLKEMGIVAENSPLIDSFIIKKTYQFYKILS